MLPHVDAEDRRAAVDERVLAVRGLGDLELAVLHRHPGPARAELRRAGGDEIRLELVVAAEVAVERLLQLARQLVAAAALLHPLPEVDVVVVLGRIVEEAGILAERGLHHLLDRLAFHSGFGGELVAVVDIGLVVLVVVVFQRLLRHEGLQCLVVIGQWGQFKSHGHTPSLIVPRHPYAGWSRELVGPTPRECFSPI
jgi:hypothetical protein